MLSGLLRGLSLASQQYGPLITPRWHGIVIVAGRVTCKSPRYLSSGCSCRQLPSLMPHHLQNLHPRSFSPGGLPRCVKFPALLFLLVSANRTCLCSVAPDVPRVQFHFDGSAWQPIDRLYALRYNRQCRRRQSAPAPEHRLLLRVFHPPSMAGFMGIPLLVS